MEALIDRKLKWASLAFVIIFFKIITFSALFASSISKPFSETLSDNNVSFSTMLKNWDSEHYLNIAEKGYEKKSNFSVNAFYPLFPLLIRALHRLLGIKLIWAGLILANLFSFFGAFLFYDWLNQFYSSRIANLSLIGLLVQPGAIFFSLIYTEGMFFFLMMLFLLALRRERTFLLILAGLALPLTRSVGILLALPLLWRLMETWRKERRVSRSELFGLLALMAGLGIYFAIMKHETGTALAGIHAQKEFVFQASFKYFLKPLTLLKSFFQMHSLFGYQDGILDRLYSLIFMGSLILLFQKNRRLLLLALPLGLIPMVTLRFSSFLRFFILVPPVIPQTVEALNFPAWRKIPLFLWFFLALGIHVFCIYRFSHGEWVA